MSSTSQTNLVPLLAALVGATVLIIGLLAAFMLVWRPRAQPFVPLVPPTPPTPAPAPAPSAPAPAPAPAEGCTPRDQHYLLHDVGHPYFQVTCASCPDFPFDIDCQAAAPLLRDWQSTSGGQQALDQICQTTVGSDAAGNSYGARPPPSCAPPTPTPPHHHHRPAYPSIPGHLSPLWPTPPHSALGALPHSALGAAHSAPKCYNVAGAAVPCPVGLQHYEGYGFYVGLEPHHYPGASLGPGSSCQCRTPTGAVAVSPCESLNTYGGLFPSC